MAKRKYVELVRQYPLRDSDSPRINRQVSLSGELLQLWAEQFGESEGGDGTRSPGAELGLKLILYLTGARIDPQALASELCRTFPGVCQTVTANLYALAECLGDNPRVEVRE